MRQRRGNAPVPPNVLAGEIRNRLAMASSSLLEILGLFERHRGRVRKVRDPSRVRLLKGALGALRRAQERLGLSRAAEDPDLNVTSLGDLEARLDALTEEIFETLGRLKTASDASHERNERLRRCLGCIQDARDYLLEEPPEIDLRAFLEDLGDQVERALRALESRDGEEVRLALVAGEIKRALDNLEQSGLLPRRTQLKSFFESLPQIQ